MSGPLYQRRTRKSDGVRVWLRSDDGGEHWSESSAPDADEAPAPSAAAQPPPQDTAPAPAPPAVAEPQTPSFGDWLGDKARSAGSAVAGGAGDLARGMGRGFTLDAMAPASAALTPEVDDGTGIPREYAAGSAQADLAASNRRDDAEAEDRSPVLTAAGRGLGMAPAAVATGGAVSTPVGMVAAPAALGLLARSGASNAATAGDWAGETFDPGAAALDATIGAALPGAAQSVGRVAQAVKPSAKSFGEWLRGVAVGGGSLDEAGAAELARKFGTRRGGATTTELGRRVEKLGLPATSRAPMSGSSYAEAAATKASALGKELGALLDRNAALDVDVPKAKVISELRALRTKYSTQAGDDAVAKARQVERAISDLTEGAGYAQKQNLTVRDLHDLKKVYEAQGGFKRGEAPAPPSRAARKDASRDVATVHRKALQRTMDEKALREDVTGLAPPFQALTKNIGSARTIEGVARGTEGRSDMTGAVARAVHEPIKEATRAGLGYSADVGATAMKGASALAGKVGRGATTISASGLPTATASGVVAATPLTEAQRVEEARRIAEDPDYRAWLRERGERNEQAAHDEQP